MVCDVLEEAGALFLGSRLKRLGERMQADVLRVVERTGLAIQPGQYPLLAALDRHGGATVGRLAQMVGMSQPAVTRTLSKLVEMNLIAMTQDGRDQRKRSVVLTEDGHAALTRSKREIWPQIESAVAELLTGVSGPLLDQLGAIEAALAERGLDARVPRLTVIGFSDDLAPAFHDINTQWIEAMFRLEDTDRDVLENPQARIIAPGGDILFVAAEGLGIVGTCALQKTGERQFELTKMGVLGAARGQKAGEFLLRATLRRAADMGAETLYLLTSSKCAAAIHLYEKLGFRHDAGIMRDFGARYQRCDVAMRFVG